MQIKGLETEYGLQVRVRTSTGAWRRLGSDEAAQRLFVPVVEANSATNVYLRNGGRLYLDVGSHPEYATPECGTIEELVAHDRAGDRIVARLADRAVEACASEGIEAKISVFKINVDSHGNSWGSHENYQVDRGLAAEGADSGLDGLATALSGFLVTRQLVCGAGHWERDRLGRGVFRISQRAAHLGDAMGTSTTRSRPLVNTRDEPHADPSLHRRLHVIAGDSTLLEPCTALRVGSTELVLRAIAAGEQFAGLVPLDPGRSIREVSADTSGMAVIEAAGGAVRALDLQRQCWTATIPHAHGELGPVHTLWGEVLDALADQRLDDIAHLVDWVAKRRLLDAETTRHGLLPDDPKLAQLDLAWHDLRGGLCALLESRGKVARWVPEEAVERAVEVPPQTRALLRSRFLLAAQANHREHAVDWMRFTCHDLPQGQVAVADPAATSDPAVEQLCARMAHEPRRSSSAGFAGNRLG